MLAWRRGVFAGGFREKCGAERGFLMVKTWWIAGETGWEDTIFLKSEIMPRFSDLFLPTW
jgi:hypothetical protein